MDRIPGLRLRVSEEGEILGLDEAEQGEFGYDFAFVER
jgi:ammonium transporter, Amt family